MWDRLRRFPGHRASAASVLALALATAIFLIDTITPLEIAVSVFYVAVVLISMGFLPRRGVMLVSAGCIGLTILSHLLTRSGSAQSGLINCAISISAILLTNYLVLKIVSAEVAASEARAQLARVARVTTMGELTASIAHEVNQPLAAVVTSANASLHWLAAEPPNLERARPAIDRIVREATRASEVIGRVRQLAKGAPASKELLSINAVIQEVILLVRGDISRNRITLETDFTDDLSPLFFDPVQIQQVVLNLIVNAVDALAGVTDRPRELLIATRATTPRQVQVTIRDSGIGLQQAQAELIFEAFHTSKEGGMGIGLAISRSIIEAHGGRVWATQNAGRGATFQFTLPASARGA